MLISTHSRIIYKNENTKSQTDTPQPRNLSNFIEKHKKEKILAPKRFSLALKGNKDPGILIIPSVDRNRLAYITQPKEKRNNRNTFF